MNPQQAGTEVVERFGEIETRRPGETSSVALAERERATIQAYFIVAANRQRSIAQFESGLLKECERPGFAEVARYSLPRRKYNKDTQEWEEIFIRGWSIRFAEAAMRHWKNVLNDAKVVYEDDEKRIMRFSVLDLEACIPMYSEVQLEKIVERKGKKPKKAGGDWTPPDGREVFGQRINTYGDVIFQVAATEDELQMKQNAAWSKFIRNVLRFMPGDILDAALVQIEKTLAGNSDEAARERLLAAFDREGISLMDLQQYLGHAVSKITPQELNALRGVYTALREHETTWDQVLESKQPAGSAEAAADVATEKIIELKREGAQPAADIKREAQRAEQPSQTSKPAAQSELTLQQQSVLQFEKMIGKVEFWRIMGAHGVPDIEAVTESNWKSLAEEMNQVDTDNRDNRPKESNGGNGGSDKPNGPQPLRFGHKPGNR